MTSRDDAASPNDRMSSTAGDAQSSRTYAPVRENAAANLPTAPADYRALFDASPTPLLVVSPPDWTIVAANDARLAVTGTTREEQVGRRLFDVFPDDPEDPEADGVRNLTASFERVVATKATDKMAVQRYAVRGPNGRFVERWWAPVNTPVLGADGAVSLIIHHVEDVTEVIRLRVDAEGRDELARGQQALIDRLRALAQAHQDAEERYLALFNAIDQGFCTIEVAFDEQDTPVDYRFIEVSPSFERQTGIRNGEGRWMREIAPDQDQFWLETYGRVALTGEPAQLENYSTPLDRWWDVYAFRIRGRHRIAVLFRDITDQKCAEAQLRESEEFNRRILASSTDCIKVLDLDGRLAFMSEGGKFIMEVDDFPSIAGSYWPDFWTGTDRDRALAALDAARAGGGDRFTGFANTMKGTARWWDVAVTPIAGPDGRPERLLAVSRDITAARETEGRLRDLAGTLKWQVAERSAERDRLWNLSQDMLARADYGGMMSAVSPAWNRVLGWSEDELLTRGYASFMHPEDAASTLDAITRMAETALPTRFENRIATVDGGWKPIEWTVAPEADGRNFIAVGRDLSHAKAREAELATAQDALRQSQKMESLGQLTGGVAHDFNNLLTVIRSSADLLRRHELPDEKRRRYIDAIADTADRAARLTAQLLAFSRRSVLKAEVFDAAARVTGIGDMIRTVIGSRVALSIDAGCHDCFVEADLTQFETALVNVVVNARDAMEGEGRLSVVIDTVDALPPTRGHAGTRGAFVAVSVTDTGAGIAPEHLERIFEPFYTTKDIGKGTGLGLSQVFGFAKQSGGEIDVRSRVGEGTTFTLYLPRADAARAAAAPIRDHARAEGQGRVLVVEDNVQVGEFAAQLLDDLGYRTTLAPNAADALDLLEADAGAFDIVFSDVVMPGMGGVELGRRLRERWPALPVVLTSGYSHVLAEDARHGFPLLHKPYSVEDLARILGRTIAEAG